MVDINFDAEKQMRYATIPSGKYFVYIKNCFYCDNGIVLEVVVAIGPYKDRIVAWPLCINDKDEDARELERDKLAKLCLMLGVKYLKSSDSLYNKEFVALIGTKTETVMYSSSFRCVNIIKDISKC